MNNEISNKPCGCGNCEPVCTTCGRPWIVCKGECGCKKPCCCKKKVNFCEYGRMAHGCIRERAPECPMQAVIPSVVVDNISNLKNLADCFVHVTSLNTTFYIDDKHRMIVTWAGPVEVDNYDYENNPLGLRSQTVYDFANNRAIYYNKTGGYEIFSLGGGGDTPTKTTYIALSFPQTTQWEPLSDLDGFNVSYNPDTATGEKAGTRYVPSVQYRKLTSGPLAYYTAEEVFTMLERGDDVVFEHVPIGWTSRNAIDVTEPRSMVDGLRMTARQERLEEVTEDNYAEITTYSGVAYANGFPFAYGMVRDVYDGVTEYKFFAQGINNFPGFN